MKFSLQGNWTADLGDGTEYLMKLPGTLDENQIGGRDTGANQWHPDSTLGNENEAFRTGEIATRFTRRYTYEGPVCLTRIIEPALIRKLQREEAAGKRVFLEAERARVLQLKVDGVPVPDFTAPSLNTRHVFEVTGLLKEGSQLVLISDNSYPELPHDAIVYSSAATDETQTNWNGVLGELILRTEEPVFLENICVYPVKDTLTVKLQLCLETACEETIRISSGALQEEAVLRISREKAETVSGKAEVISGLRENAVKLHTTEKGIELSIAALRLLEGIRRWDLEEGNLYELTVSLEKGESKSVLFGVRDFGDDGQGHLALNGRRIFLRSEANCAVFPESGHPPMEVSAWREILAAYRAYGVNCLRFHSHCPPEAAFTAADQMGMLLQPELSHWNPRDAFESEESFTYYRRELLQTLQMLANHPSFVMLTFGNELQAGEKGHERMRELLRLARHMDPTRLYADASNCHYGAAGCEEESDFYTASNFHQWELRGTFANMEGYINHRYPGADQTYAAAMEQLRGEYEGPVFGFEVGQFEVLPDFEELVEFKGISDPANLRLIRERVRNRGLEKLWNRYVEATGELALIGYREEVEAVLRTGEMSGISLLGLQDFPGQGTALVGMMNSHLESKPYRFASPERFRRFFKDQLPLVLLPKYTFETEEVLEARVLIANYGKEEIQGTPLFELWSLDEQGNPDEPGKLNDRRKSEQEGAGTGLLARGQLSELNCRAGQLTEAGKIHISLAQLKIDRPLRLSLRVKLGQIFNEYPVWVYPPVRPVCPEEIYETTWVDEKAQAVLEAGGIVYLTPPAVKEALPFSIGTQFTTDFWSVGTFAGQEGGMGQLIDASHPVFKGFPTEFHTNWQWWLMAVQRAVVLPRQYEAIITEMDSYAFLRPMAKLLECRCQKGRLLFSSMGLQELQQYPEARALLQAIYDYMRSDSFAPAQEIPLSVFQELVHRL